MIKITLQLLYPPLFAIQTWKIKTTLNKMSLTVAKLSNFDELFGSVDPNAAVRTHVA